MTSAIQRAGLGILVMGNLFGSLKGHGQNWPGEHWATDTPERAGLSPAKLKQLGEHVGGRGCVVRDGLMIHSWGDPGKSGDLASAFKPVLSTLMLMAVQEGLLATPDDRLSAVEPRLRELNQGKDANITWRHLASQLSGYGLTDKPGEAYSYNDYAITLYYDTLMASVFRADPEEVLKRRLAEPLQFEDAFTFNAFGPSNRPGRLALSCRDFARVGLLYLRNGRWRDRQLLRTDFIRMAIDSPIAANTPLSRGSRAPMLPEQRSLGGKANITPVGPGYYSFNWWLNRTNAAGQRLFVDGTPDVHVASGHGGKRVLYLVPNEDIIVCWNDSGIDDHDQCPGNPATKMNQAARLIREMVVASAAPRPEAAPNIKVSNRRTTLTAVGSRFAINGQSTFLLGLSYYGGLGASETFVRADLDDAQRHGFNWIRVWANWRAFGSDAAAVDGEGREIPGGLTKLKWLINDCDRRGMIVDVSLSRANGVSGPPRLQSLQAHQRAVETLVKALKPWRNWYLDLSNERNIRDKRYTSIGDLKALRQQVRALDPMLLVTASQGGEINQSEAQNYLTDAGLDFLSPHRPRSRDTSKNTERMTRQLLEWAKAIRRQPVPVHYQEPFRRGYQGDWNPSARDFIADLDAAMAGAAAGWCFHNGDERTAEDGQPRRSFDLRAQRLFDQFDSEERTVLEMLRARFGPGASKPAQP
jgi:hypothetical protein